MHTIHTRRQFLGTAATLLSGAAFGAPAIVHDLLKPKSLIELEYAIPAGSNAVEEVKKCLEYCRKAL